MTNNTTIRHAVRDHRGVLHPVGVGGKGGAASAIATASHNATKSGMAHDVVEIDTSTGAVRTMPVKPGDPSRPVASNQIQRSTNGAR
jgi:hypothetical protein